MLERGILNKDGDVGLGLGLEQEVGGHAGEASNDPSTQELASLDSKERYSGLVF